MKLINFVQIIKNTICRVIQNMLNVQTFKVQVTKNVYRKAKQPSTCITNILIDMFYADIVQKI